MRRRKSIALRRAACHEPAEVSDGKTKRDSSRREEESEEKPPAAAAAEEAESAGRLGDGRDHREAGVGELEV